MPQPEKKTWIEKYATALSIVVSVILAIAGWIYTNEKDRKDRLREIRHNYISNAYKQISTYATLRKFKVLTKEDFLQFDRALKEIQLYGTRNEIDQTIKLIKGQKSEGYIMDTLLNLIKNNLRSEYGLEKSNEPIWWIMDTTLFKSP